MSFAFEKLVVYQKAIDFADEVCSATEASSRGYGFLVDQLNRAALSNLRIPATKKQLAFCHPGLNDGKNFFAGCEQ